MLKKTVPFSKKLKNLEKTRQAPNSAQTLNRTNRTSKRRFNFICRKKKSLESFDSWLQYAGVIVLGTLFPFIFTYWPGAYLFVEVGELYPYCALISYFFMIVCFFAASLGDSGKFLI